MKGTPVIWKQSWTVPTTKHYTRFLTPHRRRSQQNKLPYRLLHSYPEEDQYKLILLAQQESKRPENNMWISRNYTDVPAEMVYGQGIKKYFHDSLV